jgi:hypothetical protein
MSKLRSSDIDMTCNACHDLSRKNGLEASFKYITKRIYRAFICRSSLHTLPDMLSFPHVQASTLNADVPLKAPPSSYLQDDAFLAMLYKHRCKAINCLVQQDLSQLDPVLGDASCEQRPSFLLDLYWKVKNHLNQMGKLRFFLKTVEEYNIAHENDKMDTKVRTPKDVWGNNHSRKYDNLFAELRKLLGDDHLNLLGLCYSLTVANVWMFDEFGIGFCHRSKDTYRTRTKGADDEKNSDLLVNHEPMLRHQLAKASVAYFVDLVKALPCGNPTCVVGSTPKKRQYIEEQLLEAVHWMRSSIEQQIPGEDDIELVATYPQFRAILLYEFNAGRPIIVMVRRIQITTASPSGLTYSLGDARALYFEASNDKGTYELSQIGPSRKHEPCLTFDCWSTYLAGTNGTGMNAADHAEYFEALSRCDLPWLILTFAAVHPPFTSKAKVKNPDYGPLYKVICGESSRTFSYSRERCSGFNLKMHAPNDERPTLLEEWCMATRVGSDHKLKDTLPVSRGPHDGQYYMRTDRPTDFLVHHVNVSSFDQTETHCNELRERHAKSGFPDLGQFIVRIRSVGVSCTDKTHADLLSKMSNPKKARKIYLEKYGDNVQFLT